ESLCGPTPIPASGRPSPRFAGERDRESAREILMPRTFFRYRFTQAMTVKMLSLLPASPTQRAPLPPAEISGCREVGEPSKPQKALIMYSSPLQFAAASLPWTLTTRMIDPEVPVSPLAPSLPAGPDGPGGPCSPAAPAGPTGPAGPATP